MIWFIFVISNHYLRITFGELTILKLVTLDHNLLLIVNQVISINDPRVYIGFIESNSNLRKYLYKVS